MRKKKREFSLNVGVSSILFIFVILCLVSFSTLSLASAMSDYKLEDKVRANSETYFEACNDAQEGLAELDDTLSSLYESGISRVGYFEQVGKKKSFALPLSEYQTLIVEVRINYPEKNGDTFYDITKWTVETTGTLEYDDHLNVLH